MCINVEKFDLKCGNLEVDLVWEYGGFSRGIFTLVTLTQCRMEWFMLFTGMVSVSNSTLIDWKPLNTIFWELGRFRCESWLRDVGQLHVELLISIKRILLSHHIPVPVEVEQSISESGSNKKISSRNRNNQTDSFSYERVSMKEEKVYFWKRHWSISYGINESIKSIKVDVNVENQKIVDPRSLSLIHISEPTRPY